MRYQDEILGLYAQDEDADAGEVEGVENELPVEETTEEEENLE